jgi:hypothetical protein
MKPKTNSNNGHKVVYKSNSMLRAMMLREQLEKTGIPVALKYESVEYAPGSQLNISSEVQLLVSRDMADEAQALLYC